MTAPHTFERPHRPPGVRLYNAAGRALRRAGARRRLAAERVLAAAERLVGDDGDGWGDREAVRAPLARLVASLEDDARLTPFGRLLARHTLEHFAVNRLRLERLFARRPRLAERPIGRPLVVVGLPRTGTTLLYNLLARDTDARALLTWESFWPVPRGEAAGELEATDDRVRRAAWLVRSLYRFAPAMRTIHPLAAEGPEEDTWLLAHGFTTMAFSLVGRVDGYNDWLAALPPAAAAGAYGAWRRGLQALSRPPAAGAAGGHWLLKSPAHLATLDGLLAAAPEANVICTHREPERVVPSTCSLFAVTRSVFSDDVRPRALGPEIAARLAAYERRGEEARRRFPGRVLDVAFEDLVRDPVDVAREIYRRFDYPWGAALDERLRRWSARRSGPPAHRYDLAQFGLTPRDLGGGSVGEAL